MIRRPRLAGFQDGVDDREQLVHARNQSDLHRLTVGEQALVERHQSRVMPHRSQRRHVQGGAHRRATAPCDSLPAVAATIAIERRHPNQLADLRTAQTSQFRQPSHQTGLRPSANALEPLEQRELAGEMLVQVAIDVPVDDLDLSIQDAPHRLDALVLRAIASVLDRCPIAFAKSRACLGLITITGKPLMHNATATWRS